MKFVRNIASISPKIIDASVVVIGKFDGLHLGHLQIINEAKTIAKQHNLPLVVFTFYPNPSNMLRNVLDCKILSFKQKFTLLKDLSVDILYLQKFSPEFANLTPLEFVRRFLVEGLGAKFIVTGQDYYFGRNRGGNKAFLEGNEAVFGFKYIEVEERRLEGQKISTSAIKAALGEGKIELVNKMLGREYEIRGWQARGMGLASVKLGFPTINVPLRQDLNLPKFGVYGVLAEIEGVEYQAVANIGVKPTFGEFTQPILEIHILNHFISPKNRLQNIKIKFFFIIRKEKKFPSIEALKAQIECDVKVAKYNFDEKN
jgi:riboflavin kinase/FMN adenylyltransferase